MVNTIMLSGSEIPYIEDFEDYLAGYPAYTTSWSRFLTKAAKGSVKAEDLFMVAERTLIFLLSNNDPTVEDRLLEDYYAPIHALIGSASPPREPEQFFAMIRDKGWVGFEVQFTGLSANSSANYEALWSRGRRVSEAHLLHDAILHVCNNWSVSEFKRMNEQVHASSPKANARDVVSLMLYLAFIWPEDKIPRYEVPRKYPRVPTHDIEPDPSEETAKRKALVLCVVMLILTVAYGAWELGYFL